MTHLGMFLIEFEPETKVDAALIREQFSVESWPAYRKTSLTRAARVKGPFTIETSEGPLTCADGYVAIDARGYPYPIAVDEFELIYEQAEALGAPAAEPEPERREQTILEIANEEARVTAIAALRSIAGDASQNGEHRLAAAGLLLQHTHTPLGWPAALIGIGR